MELKVEDDCFSQKSQKSFKGYFRGGGLEVGADYMKLDMMNKVLYRASLSSFMVFGLVGSFGYLIFATTE